MEPASVKKFIPCFLDFLHSKKVRSNLVFFCMPHQVKKMTSILSDATGIFKNEKVVRYFDVIEKHFDSLLQELNKRGTAVSEKGIDQMKNWNDTIMKEESDKIKKNDSNVETFHQFTMCEYLKETYKPRGMKIRVRPPKLYEFVHGMAEEISSDSNVREYTTKSDVDKHLLMKKCFRRCLKKVCCETCVVSTVPKNKTASEITLKSRLGGGMGSRLGSRIGSRLGSRLGSQVSSKASTNVTRSIAPSESHISRSAIPSQVSSRRSRAPQASQIQSHASSKIAPLSQAPSHVSSQMQSRSSSKIAPLSQVSSKMASKFKGGDLTPDDSVSQFDASHVSSRANTVHGKLTESMLALHKKNMAGPDKVVSLKAGSTKRVEEEGFFQLDPTNCDVPSEVPSQIPSLRRRR